MLIKTQNVYCSRHQCSRLVWLGYSWCSRSDSWGMWLMRQVAMRCVLNLRGFQPLQTHDSPNNTCWTDIVLKLDSAGPTYKHGEGILNICIYFLTSGFSHGCRSGDRLPWATERTQSRSSSWGISLACHIWIYRRTIKSEIVFFRISNILVPCSHAQLRGRTVNKSYGLFSDLGVEIALSHRHVEFFG